jgi:hypothetical protein
MAAGRYSFVIEQGATTNFQIAYTDSNNAPVDLTGYQARMQLDQVLDLVKYTLHYPLA